MSGISVEVLSGSGAPQVGVTVSGLPTDAPSVVTVERSTDGLRWETVRGADRVAVTGAIFVRDFVPPLNVETTYRLVTDAAVEPAATYAWTGAAGASTSTETVDGAVTRTNLAVSPRGTVAAMWSQLWGTGGAGTETVVTGATDGPVLPDGTRITSYIRGTWTTASTGGSPLVLANRTADTSGPWPTGTDVYAVVYARWSVDVGQVSSLVRWTLAGSSSRDTRVGSEAIPAGTWVPVGALHTSTGGDADAPRPGIIWTQAMPAGATVDTTLAMSVPGAVGPSPYFDGDTAPVPAPTSTTITVPSDTAWLQDPLDPRSAVPVSCLRSEDGVLLMSPSAGDLARSLPADVVQVQGARLPVASLGVRQAPADIRLHLRAIAAEQGALIRALSELIDSAGVVVLRGLPPDLPLDPVAHVIAPEVTDSPIVGGLLGPRRDWQMSVTQVRAPSPRISVPWWTYDDVAALWLAMIYDAVLAARPGAMYLDWLRDPTPEGT